MTAIFTGWFIEFILESAGAILYRKRSPLLSVILAFCALTDVSAYALTGILPPTWIYFWGAWGQFYAKELMLIWLGCAICGMFVEGRNRPQAVISAGMVSLFTIAIVMACCFSEQTLKDRLLAAECVADTILLVIVFVAWIGRGARLSNEWKWITAGFLVMVGTDVLFTIGWFSAETIRHFYPLGCIAAQLIWVAGPLRKVKLPEFRQSLEKRFPKVEEMRVM